MTLKRKITPREERKELMALDSLHEAIYEMSPHQLELLSNLAYKILRGDKI